MRWITWMCLALVACKSSEKKTAGEPGAADPLSTFGDRADRSDDGARRARQQEYAKYQSEPRCNKLKHTTQWAILAEHGYSDVFLTHGYSADVATAACEERCGATWRLPELAEVRALTATASEKNISLSTFYGQDGEQVTSAAGSRFWLREGGERPKQFVGVGKDQPMSVDGPPIAEPAKDGERYVVMCFSTEPPPTNVPDHFCTLPAVVEPTIVAKEPAIGEKGATWLQVYSAVLPQLGQIIKQHEPRASGERGDLDIQLDAKKPPFTGAFRPGRYSLVDADATGALLTISASIGAAKPSLYYRAYAGTLVIAAHDPDQATIRGSFEDVALREHEIDGKRVENGCTAKLARVEFALVRE